jgi:hypothetical protein
MSNSPRNKEQDRLIELSLAQQNAGAAKASDFKIEDRGPGQCGDTKAERVAPLAEADADQKSKLNTPLPVRNIIPDRPVRDGISLEPCRRAEPNKKKRILERKEFVSELLLRHDQNLTTGLTSTDKLVSVAPRPGLLFAQNL